MSFELVVTQIAREEALFAFQYYEQIRSGLGEEFLYELEDRYLAIIKNPHSFSYADDASTIRDTILKRFPFLVVYAIIHNSVIILSVHNTNKRPRTV